MTYNPAPFIQAIPNAVEALTGAPAGVAQSSVTVQKWRPIAARMFAQGTSITEIADLTGQDRAEVEAFLANPAGRVLVDGHLNGTNAQVKRILRGSKIDTIFTLMQLRGNMTNPAAALGACKVLLELAADSDKSTRDPQQAKAELEKKMQEFNKTKNEP